MNKLTLIGLAMFALAAIGCSSGSSNNNPNTNNGYSLINGSCVQTTTGYPAPNQSLCISNGAVISQQCMGQYYYLDPQQGWFTGMCGGYPNVCSGRLLYTASGQRVQCM